MIAADTFTGLTILALLVGLYFLPSIIAFDKGDPNKLSIGVINLFLGWTLVGWVAALAMALRASKPAAPAQPPPVPDTSDRIGQLADLRREGLLSEEEYAAAKQRALSG